MEGPKRVSMEKGPLHEIIPWWLYLHESIAYGQVSTVTFDCSCLTFSDFGSRQFSLWAVMVFVAFLTLDFALIPFLKKGVKDSYSQCQFPLLQLDLHTYSVIIMPLSKDIVSTHRENLSWHSPPSKIRAQTQDHSGKGVNFGVRHIWMQNPLSQADWLKQLMSLSESQFLFTYKLPSTIPGPVIWSRVW